MKSTILPGRSSEQATKKSSRGIHTSRQVNLDGVVDPDGRVRVADPTLSSQYVIFLQNYGPTSDRRCTASRETYVRASCVTKNGMPPLPSWTRLTLPSL